MVLLIGKLAESNRCPHLLLGTPEPMFVPAGPPAAQVMCVACAGRYLRSISDVEDRTCDLCGTIGDEPTMGRYLRIGGVLLMAGLCDGYLPRFDELLL